MFYPWQMACNKKYKYQKTKGECYILCHDIVLVKENRIVYLFVRLDILTSTSSPFIIIIKTEF